MKKVSEVAKELGVSRQSVYRRVTTRVTAELQSHVHRSDEGTILLDTEGIAIIKRLFDANSCNANCNADSQSDKGVTDEIKLFLMKQVEEKDKQISDLLRKLEIMQVLLRNEQEKGRLLIEEKKEDGLFKRWFSK